MPSSRTRPSGASLGWVMSRLHGIGLVMRHRVGERRQRQTVGLDREQLRERLEIDLEPARAVELWDQAAVGDRREIADAERAGYVGDALGERGEPIGDVRPDPVRLVAPERLDPLERRGVLQRLDTGVDDLGERARPGAQERIARQDRRIGPAFVEGLEDRPRLGQRDLVAVVVGDLERRDLAHRVLGPVGVGVLLALQDVDRDVVVRQLLEPQADPYAVAGRAAPVAMEDELHGCAPGVGCAPETKVLAATTRWSIAPNGLPPGLVPAMWASIRIRSPTAMNGVFAAPPSMISIIRRSARHDTPRLRSAFDTVPLPRMVPAVNRRVRAMCATSSKNEKCISPASQSPITCSL